MIQFNFNVLLFWVSTEDNRLYDDLSRFYHKDNAFLEDLVATHVTGYTRIDMTAGFRLLMSGGATHPKWLSCRLPSDKKGNPGQLWHDWLTAQFPGRQAGVAHTYGAAGSHSDGRRAQRVGVVELGQWFGQPRRAAQQAGATPVALIGPPGKIEGVVASLFEQVLPQVVPWSAESLDPAKFGLVLVAPTV